MKKILTIVISVALVAAIAIGGTLAYLSNDATVSNTFTTSQPGSKLAITLNEGAVVATSGLFTDAGATRVTSSQFPIIPGERMDKDPTVTVAADSSPCYVFAFVKNTSDLNGKVVASFDLDTLGEGWTAVSGRPGLYAYTGIVATSTTARKLSPLFTKMIVNSDLTLADIASTTKPLTGSLNVQAFAYQASASVTYAMAETAAVALFFPTPVPNPAP